MREDLSIYYKVAFFSGVSILLVSAFLLYSLAVTRKPSDVSVTLQEYDVESSVVEKNAAYQLNLAQIVMLPLKAGDSFSVNLKPVGTSNVSVAEVVLSYDSSLFEIDSINVPSNFLYLNDSINNSLGIVTVDIGKIGLMDFSDGETLVTFSLTAINEATTLSSIKIDSLSTLGYPNALADNGADVLDDPTDGTSVGGGGTGTGTESDVARIQCGKIDVNDDSVIDLVDFAAFIKVYDNYCSDTETNFIGCGAKDINGDGIVSVNDFVGLIKYYKQPSCTNLPKDRF